MRYCIVGLASNAFGYLLYLAISYLGIGPKLAMTLLYGVAVIHTFIFNKKWTFRHEGAATPTLLRYAAVYAAGYVINFLALIVLVDQAGQPHKVVQGIMIFAIAGMLFLAQRFWVFRQISGGSPL